MAGRTLHDQIGDKIELAQTYFEDGAPFTAAHCLREAADILDEHGEAKFGPGSGASKADAA